MRKDRIDISPLYTAVLYSRSPNGYALLQALGLPTRVHDDRATRERSGEWGASAAVDVIRVLRRAVEEWQRVRRFRVDNRVERYQKSGQKAC